LNVFVLTSIPSWGAYVVAIDASNRAAWVQARAAADALEQSNSELARANRTLTEQRDRVQRALEQQAAVARLGLYANGPASIEAVEERASEQLARWCERPDPGSLSQLGTHDQTEYLERLPVEDRPFARGILQVVQMRAVRTRAQAAPSDPSEPDSVTQSTTASASSSKTLPSQTSGDR